MFLKEGMVAIWGTAVLKNRTVTGKLSNKAKANGQTEVCPALTPSKLDALKGTRCACATIISAVFTHMRNLIH